MQKKLIRAHEGLRLFAHLCPSGKTSIGYGRNLDDTGISKKEAEIMLDNDLRKTKRDLLGRFPEMIRLDPVRQAVLIDMAYNMGVAGLMAFTQTLEHVRNGKYAEASKEMLRSRWAKQVGRRADRLSVMMFTGSWPEDI